MQQLKVVHDSGFGPTVGDQWIDRFTVRRRLAAARLGEAFIARDDERGEDVHLKILQPGWLGRDELAELRFRQRVVQLSRLAHPNLAPIVAGGVAGDRVYVATELADGELLSALVARKGRLELAEFVPIASQLLKAVGHVHARGVLLRGLCPRNVMLTVDRGHRNFVRLLNFGIAELASSCPELDRARLEASAPYRAPEELLGHELDSTADVYALGVMFFWMLSGRLPFDADRDGASAHPQISGTPRSLAEHVRPHHEIPEALVLLVDDCTRRHARQRPKNANELVERLIDAVPDLSLFKLPPADVTQSGASRRMETMEADEASVSTTRLEPTDRSDAWPISQTWPQLVVSRAPVVASAAWAQVRSAGGWLGQELWTRARETDRRTWVIAVSSAVAFVATIFAFVLGLHRDDEGPDASADPLVVAGLGHAQAPDGALASPPTTPPGATRADPAMTATLAVSASVPAEVYVDGVRKGTTPLELATRPGPVSLELRASGYASQREALSLAAGETVRLRVDLEHIDRPKKRGKKRSERDRRYRAAARTSAPTPVAESTAPAPNGAAQPSSDARPTDAAFLPARGDPERPAGDTVALLPSR